MSPAAGITLKQLVKAASSPYKAGLAVLPGARAVTERLAWRSQSSLCLPTPLAIVRHSSAQAPATSLPVLETSAAAFWRAAGMQDAAASDRVALALALPDAPTLAASPGVLLACNSIQDPYNMGSIMRTAAAFGVQGVLTDLDSAAPYSAKVARCSAGLSLRTQHTRAASTTAFIDQLTAWHHAGAQVWALAAPGPGLQLSPGQVITRAHSDARREQAACHVLVLGNEGQGIHPAVAAACSGHIHIGMAPSVESLNVAAACAVALSHAQQQLAT